MVLNIPENFEYKFSVSHWKILYFAELYLLWCKVLFDFHLFIYWIFILAAWRCLWAHYFQHSLNWWVCSIILEVFLLTVADPFAYFFLLQDTDFYQSVSAVVWCNFQGLNSVSSYIFWAYILRICFRIWTFFPQIILLGLLLKLSLHLLDQLASIHT